MLLLVFEQHVALHLEGYKTHSEVERAVITRYFLFNLANVFVTIGVGSFAEVSWFYFICSFCFVCLVCVGFLALSCLMDCGLPPYLLISLDVVVYSLCISLYDSVVQYLKNL